MLEASKNHPNSGWPSEMRALLSQVRSDTIRIMLPALIVAGLALGSSSGLSDPLPGILVSIWFGLLTFLVGLIHIKNITWAGILLVLGITAGILATAVWVLGFAAAPLMVIPVMMAALLFGLSAGIGAASIATMLLLLVIPGLPAEIKSTSTFTIWCGLGLIWLAIRPLQSTGELAWSGYERSHALLEQSRDYQLRLAQTLEDLTAANSQLERLNRLANSLRQSEEEARRAKEQFVANVSHELRTPLNMIIGFTEMIVSSPETYSVSLPPALLADLTVVLRNSQHLAELVDDVLDLSQIEAGKMALTKERISMPGIIQEAVTAVRPLYESKGLTLECTWPEESPQVIADPTRIREVVLNLLSNAGRFTAVGGVKVALDYKAGEVIVSVSDTGPGIHESDLKRLFQPFQQLDASLHKRYGGTGLGLAISRSFIEMHQGQMWVESAPGVGTTFYFSLPILPAPRSAGNALQWLAPEWSYRQRTRPSLTPAPLVRPKLLVYEKGKTLFRLLSRYLTEVDVVAAVNLPSLADELRREPAQALVINASSLEEAQANIATIGDLPYNIPAIACAVPSTPHMANFSDVSSYLVKPVSRQDLLRALEKLEIANKTVLVVDDQPEAVRLFRRILTAPENGYRVLTARDGVEGLAVMCEQKPGCVIMDLVMPEMDGFQLLAAKESDPEIRDIPVVIVSAQDTNRQPILSKGLSVMSSQGINLQQLIALIEAINTILSPVNFPSRTESTGAAHG